MLNENKEKFNLQELKGKRILLISLDIVREF